MSDTTIYKIKLYDRFDVEIEHLKDIIYMEKCRICGEDLPGRGDIFIVKCDLFPEAPVHRSCCHARLQNEIDNEGLNLLALSLESTWQKARQYAAWF